MKTKSKVIVLVEIAIVLCSLFLVALPGVAAEQTMQKVSASANAITTASEDDYVLGVYGNANEDDIIDMRDLTYVKLIFFGKKPETELADAKYDGKINPLDFIQIKLIIVGKEKELTLIDQADRIVTVNKPIKRVYVAYMGNYGDFEAIRVLGIQDKIVGTGMTGTYSNEIYFPELSKLPQVAYNDYEGILSLNPDLMTSYGTYAVEAAEKLPGVTVVCVAVCYRPEIQKGMTNLGYIYDKEDEAKHYLNDFVDEHLDLIKARTEGLSEEERPKVYEESYSKPYKVYPKGLIEVAGGRDIFADLGGTSASVDPEAVVERNPDIIIKKMKKTKSGYAVDDMLKAKAVRDEIVSRPELANVNAVKNGRVYVIYGDFTYGLSYPIAIAYYTKWFHPELFEDLDPQAIHQEWLTEFQRLDYDLGKHGVFVYHPEEHPDGR